MREGAEMSASPQDNWPAQTMRCHIRVESHLPIDMMSIRFMLAGEEIHEVDGRSYAVRPGQMLFADRGAQHRTLASRGAARGISLDMPGNAAPTRGRDFAGRALITPTAVCPLGQLLERHAPALHGDRTPLSEALCHQFRTALGEMLDSSAHHAANLEAKKPSTRQDILNRLQVARAHLHTHRERAVPLSELASVAGLSSFHLARYFASAFGLPPARYHRSLRLRRAAELLALGNLSATDIAERAGYSELSAFSHAFRREFGYPPSEMRLRSADR